MFKKIILGLLTFAAVTTAAQEEQEYGPGFWDSEIDTTLEDQEGGETNGDLSEQTDVLRRDQVDLQFFIDLMIGFPQTQWNECTERPSGNYAEAACVPRR